MPEPMSITSTAVSVTTVGLSAPALTMLTVAGLNLGVSPELLVAGFAGALAAIVLLNAVPQEEDTIKSLVSTAIRRIFVAIASSLTAGYLTPGVMQLSGLPSYWVMGAAFVIGAGAQSILRWAIERIKQPKSAAAADGGR